jgi:hypothetical protein
MQTDDLVSCSGVLALELSPGANVARLALERDDAEALAALMAEDLRALLPGIEAGRLAVAGAHFDSTELLRPGFPVFTTLEGLAARVEGGVVAFGTHDGHMPAQPLVPAPELAGGAMRLIPWTILIDPQLAETVGPAMETELVGHGETGTRTADGVMRRFDMRLEHARYFSRHDLMALVQVHYEHVNLAPLWELIETALLGPDGREHTLSAHGLAWRYAEGHARAQTPGQWLAEHTSSAAGERRHVLAGIAFELRQYAALLTAHQIPLGFDRGDYVAEHGLIIDTLAVPDPSLDPVRLYAHEAPGLGVIAFSVAQHRSEHAHVLANAWPLSPNLDPACRYLAKRFDCSSEPERLGRVVLDEKGLLTAPAATPH